jgi:hypothetical protein
MLFSDCLILLWSPTSIHTPLGLFGPEPAGNPKKKLKRE